MINYFQFIVGVSFMKRQQHLSQLYHPIRRSQARPQKTSRCGGEKPRQQLLGSEIKWHFLQLTGYLGYFLFKECQ